ncbi:MAG TPA: nucleoside transporter C-terminal domain-containing protein [Humidesulfovibrio sp.]|uniref:NupC/NupG family nucleoside CNT transporter n=1 Tax=Humidesulfovibrio sp. TaxID=2910988 RepID=UPI002BA08DFD|nr:nucleoside transporter C-terminal domain-containing protein [Humidesulfovibrio sp.]HWR05055.1 nucleoside transporter C-terminal domain-containing protein [Humidesulfovibrio sp.]
MFHSALGLCCLLFFAWLMSENRRALLKLGPWRMVVAGLGLQFAIAGLVLKVPALKTLFMGLNGLVQAAETATRAGTAFVFGFVGGGPAPYAVANPALGFSLAFQALPLVIVIAALSALFFHWGILQRVVRLFSLLLEKTMGIGGALGVGAAGSIFLGMIESPLLIRPYLVQMTRSELFALMATGLSCIAGTMLMLYASVLAPVIPDALGHILTASIIHAPAALLVAALMLPEDKTPTLGKEMPKSGASGSVDALCQGTWEGLQLFWNIVAMLIVFVAVVKLANLGLALLPDVAGAPLTLERGLGVLLAPVAWLIGIPWAEAHTAGALIGTKIILNEFLAFMDMAALPPEALSAPSRLILAYAMCSFANFGSVGILIAGLGTLCPERRSEITGLSMRALLAGVIASLMTGTVVGIIASM